MTNCLLYGATGYSGSRIARAARRAGLAPILAGRNPDSLRPLAKELGLPWRAAELSDTVALCDIFQDVAVVLNCAGPFVDTHRPVLDACLRSGSHYLDISGEVAVYESLAAQQAAALKANIMLMPGIGFDMVPGDCLALGLQQRLPDATELCVAYSIHGSVSRGTLRSMPSGNTVLLRRANALVADPAPQAKRFQFDLSDPQSRVDCQPLSFGDISIAWRSTGIANIRSYMHVSEQFQVMAMAAASGDIDALPAGPDDAELRAEKAYIAAEIRNAQGDCRRASMTLPHLYQATFDCASEILKRCVDGETRPGFQTPAGHFGSALIEQLGYDCQWE